MQDAPYEEALPTVKPLVSQEGRHVGGVEVEVVAGGLGATGLGAVTEGGCQPGATVSRSLLATRREPSFVRGERPDISHSLSVRQSCGWQHCLA